MPVSYSLDLRKRIAAYVEAGHSRRAAAAHFSVSASFVINLMTALRERMRTIDERCSSYGRVPQPERRTKDHPPSGRTPPGGS